MRNKQIYTFFNPNQVCVKNIMEKSASKSPLKPRLLMQKLLNDERFTPFINVQDKFTPMKRKDIKIAHTPQYVDAMLDGTNINLRSSNGLPWSPELARSVQYTNKSIFQAIRHAVNHPDRVTFSPTSGFHHARPTSGSGFCTFSGQVIASVKMYEKYGVTGAYLDLDGHFGNSIEDSREFIKKTRGYKLSDAIAHNFNPRGEGKNYLNDLSLFLKLQLETDIRNGKVHYIVWCHGADSHKDDDLGHQLSTEQWVEASKMFYSWLRELEEDLGRHIPLTLSLFGGYRRDDYESVLSLHLSDIRECINTLLDGDIRYETKVAKKELIRVKTRTKSILA